MHFLAQVLLALLSIVGIAAALYGAAILVILLIWWIDGGI